MEKNKLNIFVLVVAILISVTSAYYSVSGLVSIFSGSAIPVAIMGSVLELGKLTTTLHLHKHWKIISGWLRAYLTLAIFVLMTITSMGIFGFLSKAHVQQSLNGSDTQIKITELETQINSINTEKISYRTTLTQLDTAINQIVSQSKSEDGAAKALKIRNDQKSERTDLDKEIQTDQNKIDQLQQQEIPLKLEMQKNDVDVGPIKYIAALIYGSNPNQDLLEKAVRWVIILLVIVFDPLAIALLLASDLHKITPEPEIKNEEPLSDVHIDDLINQISTQPSLIDRLTERERSEIIKKLSSQVASVL